MIKILHQNDKLLHQSFDVYKQVNQILENWTKMVDRNKDNQDNSNDSQEKVKKKQIAVAFAVQWNAPLGS